MTKDSATTEFVREDGTYPTVPLRKDKIAIGIVQTQVKGIDKDPVVGLRKNLDHMLHLIDLAQSTGRCDLLSFHECPLQGYGKRDRKKYLQISLEAPGPEMEEIGKKAKKWNCYISFGALLRDKDWPDHVMNTQILIGPDGEVRAKHWKQRSRRGTRRTTEQFTTCIYDVLDRFVEMYGWDAVIPIEKTDIGNIAMSPVQYESELFRCMALKGAEIIIRPATGGFRWEDMMLTSYHNDLFTVVVNNSLNTYPERLNFEEHAPHNDWVGRSSIFGPKGIVLAEAGPFETKRRAVIDMAEFRQEHHIPDVQISLYRHIYDQYKERVDPNTFLDYLPNNGAEASKFIKEKARWQNYWYDF